MTAAASTSTADSPYAWARLAASLGVGAIGGVGMWSVAVVLPAVQAEFGVARGAASFPYTMTMLGLAAGGLFFGRMADRRGIRLVIALGIAMMAIGYVLAAQAAGLGQFILIQGLIVGFGAGASFGPLVADTSLWFEKRRGLAVALCASGNYLAGAIWPTALQWGIANHGWRATYVAVAAICVVATLPLLLVYRRPPPHTVVSAAATAATSANVTSVGLNPRLLQFLLIVAGVACCVGMSMPQVHIVAYCGDLGFGTERGAQMLSIMLACGIVSRLVSGFICDRIGGLATLLLGSSLQCLMLFAYLPVDSLTGLYIVSALFGLVQGGIVPSYALIVREFYPASEAGTRVSAVLMATIVGMALGGWLSGVIFDLTGSYRMAFLHGIAWNMLNIAIALFLFQRRYRSLGGKTAVA